MNNQRSEEPIREGELYTVQQLKVRMGVKDSFVRTLRRRGLPVIRIGCRPFYSGREIIKFMEEQGRHGESESHQEEGTAAPRAAVA